MFLTMAGAGNSFWSARRWKHLRGNGSGARCRAGFRRPVHGRDLSVRFTERLLGHPPRWVLLIADAMALLVVMAIGFCARGQYRSGLVLLRRAASPKL
ncbi:MAG: hypothetical protein M9905_02785 [Rhizobiaceae bacterium]|nr:hypothetical protein [Rhizobiaceae bacterium]